MALVGDIRGRKRMFTLSVLLAAIPTLLIGLMPAYASVSAAAALLLLALRLGCGDRQRGPRRLGVRRRAEMRHRAALSRELPLSSILRRHDTAVIGLMISTWFLMAAIVAVA